MAMGHSTMMSSDTPPSRASSLPQGFALYMSVSSPHKFIVGRCKSVHAFVIPRLTADMDAAIITHFPRSVQASIVAHFPCPMNTVVIADFA
jgi:hypothetical protein